MYKTPTLINRDYYFFLLWSIPIFIIDCFTERKTEVINVEQNCRICGNKINNSFSIKFYKNIYFCNNIMHIYISYAS